jgi:hypothetical protein
MIARLRTVLDAFAAQPRDLKAYLARPGPDFPEISASEVDALVDLLLSKDPNSEERSTFSNLLYTWDNIKEDAWTHGTQRNTAVRRKRIHELLRADVSLAARIDELLPFFHIDEPVIIQEHHTDWYKPERGFRDYYWTAYTGYLKNTKGWDKRSILSLDNTTHAIVECLANPESRDVYASRGLVMGYVQSGKTANFSGVIARAADAGYRLIIVLAGTWNILRNQTQRRLDKELLGKELLQNDEAYIDNRPDDWDEFLDHGFHPSERGIFTWQRLTRPDIDYRRLRQAIDSLRFERRDATKPLYDPANLHALPVKLLVIKKHSAILKHLIKDLRLVQDQLAELPVLIIDDESDQAGLNTVNPGRKQSGTERTATNEGIVELLGILPRCQYVGYTATPYANALVDPDDPEDLFPKDFIVSLDRPAGYMGVTDFFDPESEYEDLDPDDYTHPEIAFVRRVESSADDDDNDIMGALRSYVISGALKIYRQEADPKRYSFRHHTMLIHTSVRRAQHADISERVRELWNRCAFNSPKGLVALNQLWEEDYSVVCAAQGADQLAPADFEELKPYLAECVGRISGTMRFVLVLNSDSENAPDFTREAVWKIIVGGNKLSRGYTVEGLTISYYRRVANTGDTLMQMGRWFGFRPGYRDLVRVYIGVREGRAVTDLASLFRQVCVMEERFREEVRRYLRIPGAERITPRQIPPLISIAGNLPPTARSKMFNAHIVSRNYGGRWTQPTLTAAKLDSIEQNKAIARRLLNAARYYSLLTLGGLEQNGHALNVDSQIFEATTEALSDFIRDFHWLETDYLHPDRPDDISLQIEFLRRGDHGIRSWLILAPQRRQSFGDSIKLADAVDPLKVKLRHRVEGRGFQQFGEPGHRALGEFLSGLTRSDKRHVAKPNKQTLELRDPRRGVMILYPVREFERGHVSIGFELLYPANDLPQLTGFSVRRRSDRVVVQAEREG